MQIGLIENNLLNQGAVMIGAGGLLHPSPFIFPTKTHDGGDKPGHLIPPCNPDPGANEIRLICQIDFIGQVIEIGQKTPMNDAPSPFQRKPENRLNGLLLACLNDMVAVGAFSAGMSSGHVRTSQIYHDYHVPIWATAAWL